MAKIFFITEFAETLDLAIEISNRGHEVLMFTTCDEYKAVGDGIIKKEKDWFNYLGKGYIWSFDGCNSGAWQEWLRSKGEAVVGGCLDGDTLENNRQVNQLWFKILGFEQPFSKNFKSIDDTIGFIQKNLKTKYILKQNGDAPKRLNHPGKFENNEDMLFHLKELKKGWNDQEYGKFDCDLMEMVDGTECAASAFFNGNEFLKNKNGKVVGFINFEEKKECDGGMGVTTGEMGTTFIGVTEDNKVFNQIIMNPRIADYLRSIKFHGVFDINGTLKKDGKFTAFEPTMRPGVPATSYEFIEGMLTDPALLLQYMAKGEDKPIEIREGIGIVMVIAGPPFPVEADVADEETSLGERLWILKNGKPAKDFDDEQEKHIHLYNFEKTVDEETGEICYKVATKHGYLLTVTGSGKTVKEAREKLIEYIKDNIYLTGMKFRTDIGKRIEEYVDR